MPQELCTALGRTQRTDRREREKRRSTIIGEKEFNIKKKKGTDPDRPNVSALANNSLETGDGLGDIEFLQNERRHRPAECLRGGTFEW
jgi:hypothetical protein